MKRENNIKYELKSRLYERENDLKNNETRREYEKNCDKFAEYLKENGIKKPSQVEKKYGSWTAALQDWADDLKKKGKSASTIKTYIAAPCKALGIKRSDLKLDKRRASDIKKTRIASANPQGKAEEADQKNQKLIDFANAVGIRRAEIGRVTGASWVKDESGYDCIKVKGKGGKVQMQRILPQDIETVKKYFEGLKPDEKVFKRNELNNKISLHSIRASHARACYDYYKNRLDTDPEYRGQLKIELWSRYNAYHINGDSKRDKASRKAFGRQINNETKYTLRGGNKDRALTMGRPISYDRLALLAVSVFHLSHWRNDVTVINYML